MNMRLPLRDASIARKFRYLFLEYSRDISERCPIDGFRAQPFGFAPDQRFSRILQPQDCAERRPSHRGMAVFECELEHGFGFSFPEATLWKASSAGVKSEQVARPRAHPWVAVVLDHSSQDQPRGGA